ncbi:hypothetical protein [Altibacter sp. HG106]|uniref:hypothetical protein n=1 Tax=Altibacter sp. HG106 TaxID=3023937 RepID=UPI0023507CC4|nr:hypothetical protein [Altibacter sp. HG106]MDC7995225.1 hypothetical protein [Altibacter sp. HG106]
MKKVMFVVAIAMGSLTTMNAQEVAAADATQNPTLEATQVTPAQDKFVEVKVAELPEAVTNAVNTDMKDASVTQAFKNDKNVYRLVITNEDGTSKKAVITADGTWIKEQ